MYVDHRWCDQKLRLTPAPVSYTSLLVSRSILSCILRSRVFNCCFLLRMQQIITIVAIITK